MSAESPAPVSIASSGRDRLLASVVEYFATHGIGDASLRQIATAVGTSHRMLIYHFQSREGLLEAVVDQLERNERDLLDEMMADTGRPGRERAWAFWTHVADVVDMYGPLFFELASRAMRNDDVNAPLRVPNVDMWVEALGRMWRQADLKPAQARVHARLNLAVARGLLHDLLLTRDRDAVDRAMLMWDWICYREPHPTAALRRTSATWVSPQPPE